MFILLLAYQIHNFMSTLSGLYCIEINLVYILYIVQLFVHKLLVHYVYMSLSSVEMLSNRSQTCV